MENTDCCLCHHNDHTLIYSGLPDRLLDTHEPKFTFVKCKHCGLIYQSPRPTQDEISSYYPDRYDSYEISNLTKTKSWLAQKAYDYGQNKRSHLITHYKASGRLLDVGCATGTFLTHMRRHLENWQLNGVEISPHASEIARTQFNLDVFTGTLEEAHFTDQYFDVITLWEVLEHLYNPIETLIEVHRILKKDGIIVLRIPNGSSLDACLFKQYWEGLDPPRHLFVFTPTTMKGVLKEAGFKALNWNTSSGSYLAFLLSLKFWLNDQSISISMKKRLLKALSHPIARIISAPLFFPSSLLNIGPHMVVIAIQIYKWVSYLSNGELTLKCYCI